MLKAAGKRTGLFTSPHLVKINERFVIDEEEVSDEEFLEAFHTVMACVEQMKEEGYPHPTYFELLFLIGMKIFEKEKTEYLVLETGLIGIVSYLAAMLSGLKSAAKACKLHCPREVRLITIGAAAAVAGILVNCLADYLWNYPRVMVIFWFLFAILLSGVKLARRYAQKAETEGEVL